jgi:hypothetical protein
MKSIKQISIDHSHLTFLLYFNFKIGVHKKLTCYSEGWPGGILSSHPVNRFFSPLLHKISIKKHSLISKIIFGLCLLYAWLLFTRSIRIQQHEVGREVTACATRPSDFINKFIYKKFIYLLIFSFFLIIGLPLTKNAETFPGQKVRFGVTTFPRTGPHSFRKVRVIKKVVRLFLS